MSGDDDLVGTAYTGPPDSLRMQLPPSHGPTVSPSAPAKRMLASRSQIVFGQRGEIEMFLWTTEHTRRVRISMTQVPFSILALGDARVAAALEHWMKNSPDQDWMTWSAIRSALAACAVDIGQLTEEYPPN